MLYCDSDPILASIIFISQMSVLYINFRLQAREQTVRRYWHSPVTLCDAYHYKTRLLPQAFLRNLEPGPEPSGSSIEQVKVLGTRLAPGVLMTSSALIGKQSGQERKE